ncbi:glycoside hydrolase family 43 protein [Bacteroides sp. 51]|uniref:glycoside hydrolase family 43 protein n=1 Tax=Bacteroides sp. 51 TaxID=2302938 RepID=UPI0013D0624C|nr:glycoside hydrolase family 43 protein [Bacteroides sp. 51]NDV81566.1 glycoside hydrolase family 43 protein [Bacteroides sp. 51]
MKSILSVVSAMIVFLAVTVACGSDKKNASEARVAQFDYFKYEGKDAWFNQAINPETQYFNPVIAGFYPDPSICRKGDTYYLVTSTFSFFPGVPIFTSKDLVNWEQIGHVLDRPSQLNLTNQGISAGIFAPAIEYNQYNDTFYMITTGVGAGGNFFVKTKDPAKGWSDPILLPEVKGIDPSFMFDEDGKGYIVHNDEPENGPDWEQQRTIRIHEFDVENDRTIGKNKEIVRGGVNPKDKPIWIEAPHLYKINGYYYLMCAEGGTSDWHSEVIFRSKKPFGPYEPAKYNPILTQRRLPDEREYKITNSGHADLLQTPEGDWWAVFLACRPYEGNVFNTGRETFMLPVTWKDGFPIILPKDEAIPTVVDKKNLTPGAKYLTGNFVYNQEFDDKKLDYSWIYIRTPQKDFFTLEDGKLNITPMNISIEERKSPAAVLRRQQHTSFIVETQLEYIPQTADDFAGFTLFQNEAYQFLFGKTIIDGKEKLALYRMAGDKEIVAAIELNKKDAAVPIRLKVEGKGRYYDFSYAFDGEDWKTLAADADAINLSTEHAKGFVGAMIGLYATTNHLKK